jgi:hypothetical protein
VRDAEELTAVASAADGGGTDSNASIEPAARAAEEEEGPLLTVPRQKTPRKRLSPLRWTLRGGARGDAGLRSTETEGGGEASADPAPPDGAAAEGDSRMVNEAFEIRAIKRAIFM